jgi:hypothetical protein
MSSGIEYITQDEIEEHEATMQRVVEDEKREQEAAQTAFNETVRAAEEAINEIKKKAKDDKEEKLVAMQRDFKRPVKSTARLLMMFLS